MQSTRANDRAASRLRILMQERMKTNQELAIVLSVSPTSASRRRTGRTALTLDDVQAVAEWLEVPMTEIISNDSAIFHQQHERRSTNEWPSETPLPHTHATS